MCYPRTPSVSQSFLHGRSRNLGIKEGVGQYWGLQRLREGVLQGGHGLPPAAREDLEGQR